MPAQLDILICLTLGGLIYFIFLRKTFDFVSAAFFGQLIYFSPGFYGYVANPYYPGILPSVPIIDQSYVVWNLCLGATLITGILYRPRRVECTPLETSRSFDLTVLGLIILSGMLTLFTSKGLFSSDKTEVLDNIDRFFLLFASCCQIGVVSFLVQRKWLFLIIPAGGILFLLYAGFRAEFAISVIAIATYLARRHGVFAYFRPKNLVPALAAVAILVGYKPFLTAYRLGNWQVLNQLQMSDNIIETITLQFEPFLTQAVLNEALLRNFQVPASTVYQALVAAVPFLAPTIGITPDEVSFNFQDYLFPNIPYGMTASPETQFIAALGYSGLLLYIVVLNVLLVIASRGMNSKSPQRQLFAISAGAFLAFYVQRNDLANSLTLVDRMLLAVFLCWLGSWIITAGNALGGASSSAGDAGQDRARIL